jgi:hypothetical protein
MFLKLVQRSVALVRMSTPAASGSSGTLDDLQNPKEPQGTTDGGQEDHPSNNGIGDKPAASRRSNADEREDERVIGPALPPDFVMPLTMEDSNGLHAVSLSLFMLSSECQAIIVNLQEVNRFWREA